MILSREDFINKVNGNDNIDDELKAEFIADLSDTFSDYESRYNVDEVNKLRSKYENLLVDYKNRFINDNDNNDNVKKYIPDTSINSEATGLQKLIIDVNDF